MLAFLIILIIAAAVIFTERNKKWQTIPPSGMKEYLPEPKKDKQSNSIISFMNFIGICFVIITLLSVGIYGGLSGLFVVALFALWTK